jgi:SanA protein
MFWQVAKMILKMLIISITFCLIVLVLTRVYSGIYSIKRTFSENTIPQKRLAIVFGAGLLRNGSPSPVLGERVQVAANLYFAGRVEKILMSGDNSYIDYNEPAAMQNFAVELGVPEEDIILDYAGRRTYDTCYRARDIFKVQDVILVTQSFHLPRTLITCNGLGVKAIGITSDLHNYHGSSLLYWNLREILATPVALWEVYVSRPLPVLGAPEPIFP